MNSDSLVSQRQVDAFFGELPSPALVAGAAGARESVDPWRLTPLEGAGSPRQQRRQSSPNLSLGVTRPFSPTTPTRLCISRPGSPRHPTSFVFGGVPRHHRASFAAPHSEEEEEEDDTDEKGIVFLTDSD